ncbi:hypothetical protein F3Y22_tig00110174pilonHSYRG00200 [Hibiscus syriacus]|uniref:Reverse transcriptase domain-containing protein n=1 Tax=Hibiscus syriacus TaxID=106335 RepID=A0A6A3BEC7_HIBSY|nr:hypothetical protein F3Y22_tig00110174pilonHSYRG00200 [Hibiscus syriacus]
MEAVNPTVTMVNQAEASMDDINIGNKRFRPSEGEDTTTLVNSERSWKDTVLYFPFFTCMFISSTNLKDEDPDSNNEEGPAEDEIPTIKINSELKEKIRKSWRKALIIKLLGRTAWSTRGKFARMCVEVDLNKPLLSKTDQCPVKIKEKNRVTEIEANSPKQQHEPQNQDSSTDKSGVIKNQGEDKYGPWMFAALSEEASPKNSNINKNKGQNLGNTENRSNRRPRGSKQSGAASSAKQENVSLLETKYASGIGKTIQKKLKFENCYEVTAHGMREGAFILWNRSQIKLHVRSNTDQAVHCGIEEGSRNWLISFVWDSCNLLDVGSSGNKFNWVRQITGQVTIQERLDRASYNANSVEMFPNIQITNLVRQFSDHHPILMETGHSIHFDNSIRPIRFEAIWLNYPDFKIVFGKAWERKKHSIVEANVEVTKDVCLWKNTAVENIFAKKRNIQNRLRGIQKAPHYSNSTILQHMEKNLQSEYQHILNKEELLWLQKYIIDWERNTRFFHLMTQIRHLYKMLYSSKEVVPLGITTMCSEKQEIAKIVSNEEVGTTLFYMKNLKAPGPDGIQPIIYKQNWEVFGDTVLNCVSEAFKTRVIDSDIVKAYQVLILKTDNADKISLFRPISLLNTSYKILAKILVSRIRSVIQRLVGPFQNIFLHGRGTSNNILVV